MSTDDRVPPNGIGDDIAQWTKARLGKVTASRVYDAIHKTKSGWSTSRRNYMVELISERLTGMRNDVFLNQSMIWGAETEYAAGNAYQKRTGNKLQRGWVFIDHPKINMSGASPDARIGDDGLLEIKCPNTSTHIDTLLSGDISPKYTAQIQWQLASTERSWCDFCSYDPRVPHPLSLYVKRIERDDKTIAEMEKLVREFLAELDSSVDILYKQAINGASGSHITSEDVAATVSTPSNLFRKNKERPNEIK